MNKRWITLDLDGTLMQNPFGAWVFPEVASTVSRKLGREHDIVAELIAEHEKRMALRQWVAAYDWDDMLSVRCAALGVQPGVDIEALVRKHCVPPKVHLLEQGIPETLRKLRGEGFALAVVTNGFYKYQAPVMEVLGILELFEAIITPERAGTGKPDPAIFQHLPGEVLAHVGDRLDQDVHPANQMKIVSVLIERKMPEAAKGISPYMRVRDQRVRELCTEKGRRECQNNGLQELPEQFVPRAIIHSLTELPMVLGIENME